MFIKLIICGLIVITASCSTTKTTTQLSAESSGKITRTQLREIHGVNQINQRFYWCKQCKHVTPKTISANKHERILPAPETVYFDFNQSALTPQAQQQLNVFVQKARAAKGALRIEISAYTDSISNKAINERLAQERAHAVLSFLQKKLRNKHVTYQTSAHGKCCYAQVPTDSATNRRAVIHVKRSQK